MKKKIIAISLIIILLVLSSNISAQNNLQEETEKPESGNNNPIDHFSWGFIKGTYEIKKIDEYGHIILKNSQKNNKTIRITGFGWEYLYGVTFMPRFGSVTSDKVQIVKFIGICHNGKVFGFGYKRINYLYII